MAQAVPASGGPGASDNVNAAVRLFTAGLPSPQCPIWYYQDLQGQLQGPFDANTMSRWCGENALPKDLKCLGVHPQDSNVVPSSGALNHFQPLEKLLENTAAGIQYMPVRLGKGSYSDEGPATPQSAQPPKGSRVPVGPGGPGGIPGVAPGAAPLNGGNDVTRAVDQRSALAAAAAAAAAAGGSINGFPAQQQAALQGNALMAHLQQIQQRQAAGQPRPQQQQQQQQPQQGAPGRRPTQPPGAGPNQFMHEQHAGFQQQGSFIPPGAAAAAQDGDGAAELTPNDEAWEPAFIKLIKREGFVGKEADVKWRVILQSGDRVGPFSTDQMIDWMLGGKPPKGINKQQAQQTAQNPPALQVAGILSSDYNAQRLPGAKFFKPLGSLLALVAAGMQYQAVNKHDLQRGLPNKGWNEGVAAGGAKPGGPTPPLPAGKGATGKAAKAAAAAAARGSQSTGPKNAQLPGNRSNNQLPGPRSRSSTPGGLVEGAEGPAASTTSSKSSSFKHPMALRQQQRQQEAMLAAAGQGLPGQPGMLNSAGPGPQLGKGLPSATGRGGPMSQPGSASRSILTAASSMGAAGLQPAGLQQQQQLAVAAQQAAAGRLGQGLAAPQQQFLTQQQMQAASMAFLQAQQPGGAQTVWLKQQQPPGQALAGVYPVGQTLLGYPGMPGTAFNPMAAAAGVQGADGGAPRSSSTGSSAQQQPPPPSASGAQSNPMLPQQLQTAEGQAWQLQQQAAAAAAAAGKVRPPVGVPGFAMAQPGAVPGQPGIAPSHQLTHVAALLFLHGQQMQQQPQPDKPQTQWWVQRNELAFSGPFTGLQMYQAYLQATGPLRLTETTPIAAVAGNPAAAAAAAMRDVPPTRAFAPLSCLLEAAAQGFVLVPWPSAATSGGRDNGPQTLLVQQAQSGVTIPLQSVLSQANMLALQQQQQQPGGGAAGEQQGGEGSSGTDQAGFANAQQQHMLAAKQRQQQQPQAQMMAAIRPAAGGYIQLPNGQLVPAAGLIPMQGGGLAMLQATPAAAAPQPPAVDPLAVANALFTAGGQPNTIVWYVRTDGPDSGEGQQSSSVQGPFDPQEMLNMYREGRLGAGTMLCATHRAGPGQQQLPPPHDTFKPLHALMHTVSTPGGDTPAQHGPTSVPVTSAAGAGLMQQQMVPAGMILSQAPGSMGPVLFQVPVSSGGAASTVLAMPAGMQLQQMGAMSGVPQMTGPPGPYMQTPQGMMAQQQQMMAALAAQQQQAAQAQAQAQAQAHAQQQQQQQHHHHQQQASEQGQRPGVDNGPASTGGSSSSVPAQQQLAAAASSGAPQQSGGGAPGSDPQRAGAVPPRVDTWGSLAAAQELLQRRPSASSSNGQQTPAAAANPHSMEAALAAAAASSRRASVEGHLPQGGSGAMMLLSGGQHMHHHMQQQPHYMQGGPRSSSAGHHPGAFGGPGHHAGPGHVVLPGFGLSGPRSTSSIGRHHPPDGAAAAAAAASALAAGLTLQGAGSPSFGQMQAQQQYLMQAAMLAGMAPQSAAMLQQQQHMQMQPQQQAAALAAVSAAAAPPGPPTTQPPPPPAASAAAAAAAAAAQPTAPEAQPAAASETPSEA